MTEGVRAGMTEEEGGNDGSGALASLALEGGNDKGDQRGDTIPPAVIPDVVNRESTGFFPMGDTQMKGQKHKILDSRFRGNDRFGVWWATFVPLRIAVISAV